MYSINILYHLTSRNINTVSNLLTHCFLLISNTYLIYVYINMLCGAENLKLSYLQMLIFCLNFFVCNFTVLIFIEVEKNLYQIRKKIWQKI